MRIRLTRILSSCLLVLMLPSLSPAQISKTEGITAAVLMGTGAGLIYGSFDFGKDCGSSYGVAYNGDLQSCVSVGRTSVDVHDPYDRSSLERPWMFWGGLGLVVIGIVPLLPDPVQKVAPSIHVSRKGWSAVKTLRW